MGCDSFKKENENKYNKRFIRNDLGYDNNNQNKKRNNSRNNNNEDINFINYDNNEINIEYRINNENDCNKNIQLLKKRCENKISELTKKHNEEIKNLKDKYRRI